MKRSLFLCVAALVLLLSGCASTVVTRVTAFHHLSGSETEKSYTVVAGTGQANDLEYANYVTMLNQQLQRHGFILDDKNAALKVSLNYGTTPALVRTLEPDPMRYRYWYGPYRRSPFYDPFWSPFRNDDWRVAVESRYQHQIDVAISRAADGKNIYSVRARTMSNDPELSDSMDYLMDSAFQHFPAKNGVTESVVLPELPK